jgi:hypothetical protein
MPERKALPMLRRGWLLSAGLLSICAAALAAQLFVPHFIGIANNGDFGKVTGWLSMAAPDGGASNFIYFQPDYVVSAKYHWQSSFYSSETVLAWVATRLSGSTGEGNYFDIRAMGAVHCAIFLAAIAVFLGALRGLPGWGRFAIAGIAILSFTDVCYAAYMNTFYMDAAAFCSLLLLVATACRIAVTGEPSSAMVILYGLAGLVYVTSKTQHAIWMMLPVAFLVYVSLQWQKPALRRLGLASALIILTGGALELATADRANKSQALFNKLFFQIGVAGPQGADDLRALGVRSEELRYIGLHSYAPASPSGEWIDEFYLHTGYGRLLVWYLRHPWRTVQMLNHTLSSDAREMRQNNLSNYQRSEGHPWRERTTRFAAWSTFRSMLFKRWPNHVVIWYGLFVTGAIATIRKRASRPAVRLGWLSLGIVILALGQFAVASLADCLETGRHLFMFHVCTEMTICAAVAWGVEQVRRRKESGAAV